MVTSSEGTRPVRRLLCADDVRKRAPTACFSCAAHQMVVNLLSNAVKFTPAGGEIKIDARLASPNEEIRTGSGRDDDSNNDGVDGNGPGNDDPTRRDEIDGDGDDGQPSIVPLVAGSNPSSPVTKRLSFTRAIRAFADSSMASMASMGRGSGTSSNGGGGSGSNGSKRPSLNSVHNSHGFNVDNNFNNGLVVDLDGSNGLLASLGETDLLHA